MFDGASVAWQVVGFHERLGSLKEEPTEIYMFVCNLLECNVCVVPYLEVVLAAFESGEHAPRPADFSLTYLSVKVRHLFYSFIARNFGICLCHLNIFLSFFNRLGFRSSKDQLLGIAVHERVDCPQSDKGLSSCHAKIT